MNKLKIGVTGHTGFIGSHLVDRLSRETDREAVLLDDRLFENPDKFTELLRGCDCVVNLAGMNRGDEDEIYKTNIALAKTLVECLDKAGNKPHLIFASSILSLTDSAFGRSKKKACAIFADWARRSGASVSLLTIPNVFGDRCRPFYNSVVATFCYQLTRGEQPKIIKDREVEFIYINNLIEIIYKLVRKSSPNALELRIKGTKKIKVSGLLTLLESFRDKYIDKRIIPALPEPFLADLFNTFLSYIDHDKLVSLPQVHSDNRGELFEIIKLAQGGQVFSSVSKPGVTRGNHYHTRKIERFCVIKGQACIRLRRIGTQVVREFKIDASRSGFVDIPIFCTHNIQNTGNENLYALFWANELFDPADPDTFFEEV